MSDNNPTVWLIEDSIKEARIYARHLERSRQLEIEHVYPEPSLEHYAHLVSDPHTGAFLIDYQLGDEGGVSYDGVEVADFLRTLRPELPIFILTNYTHDAEKDGSLAVDGIMDKGNVGNQPDAYVARILRSMSRYEEALSDKEQRLKTLIDKKIADSLTEQEEQELATLRADIERPFDFIQAEHGSRVDAHLQRQEESLNKLEELFATILEEMRKDK